MSDFNQLLDRYEASLIPPTWNGYLGAFINGAFRTRVATNPARTYVRYIDGQVTTARYPLYLNLDSGDQKIGVMLGYQWGKLWILDFDEDQAGAIIEGDPTLGGGVMTVTGTAVDNTDPRNPVVDSPAGSIDTTDDTVTVSPTNTLRADPNFFSFTDDGGGQATLSFIGSTGGNPYTAPPTTGWTALNSPTTFTTTGNKLYLEGAANATFQIRGEYRTAPSTPYTITIAALLFLPDGNAHAGIGWYDSSGGKLTVWGIGVVTAGSNLTRTWYKWTNTTTLNSNYVNTNQVGVSLTPIWLRITDDGTNHIVSESPDGSNWFQISSQLRTNWIATPDKLVIAVSPGSSLPASLTILSWLQT